MILIQFDIFDMVYIPSVVFPGCGLRWLDPVHYKAHTIVVVFPGCGLRWLGPAQSTNYIAIRLM